VAQRAHAGPHRRGGCANQAKRARVGVKFRPPPISTAAAISPSPLRPSVTRPTATHCLALGDRLPRVQPAAGDRANADLNLLGEHHLEVGRRARARGCDGAAGCGALCAAGAAAAPRPAAGKEWRLCGVAAVCGGGGARRHWGDNMTWATPPLPADPHTPAAAACCLLSSSARFTSSSSESSITTAVRL
jgi:hypothetical protein